MLWSAKKCLFSLCLSVWYRAVVNQVSLAWSRRTAHPLYPRIPTGTPCSITGRRIKGWRSDLLEERSRARVGLAREYIRVVGPGSDWRDLGTEWTDPGSEWTDPGTNWTDPGLDYPSSDWPDPCSDWPDPCSDWPDSGSDWLDPDLRLNGSAFRLTGSGFRLTGSAFRLTGSGFRVNGFGYKLVGSGFRLNGSGFRLTGSWFRLTGSWFRLTGCGPLVKNGIQFRPLRKGQHPHSDPIHKKIGSDSNKETWIFIRPYKTFLTQVLIKNKNGSDWFRIRSSETYIIHAVYIVQCTYSSPLQNQDQTQTTTIIPSGSTRLWRRDILIKIKSKYE